MAGERILVVDQSASVQEMCKSILEEHGMIVTVASNGLAALTHPEIQQFDLVLVDSEMEGIDGLETTRQIKTGKDTYKIPVLLLVPEDTIDLLDTVPLKGATGWISKPFSPAKLKAKVHEVIEEQNIRTKSEQYLSEAAEAHMRALAEQKIQSAVEKKIQIIVERAIQSIVSIIDQRARREVEARVTNLTSEKEQELVKMTVQEVARSMVEKLAERKVTEAMNAILVEQTDKALKRSADSMLPAMVRDRLRDQIESTLPREIENRVNKAAEARTEEVSKSLVEIIRNQSQKIVPTTARELLPPLVEERMNAILNERAPKIIADSARTAVANELHRTVRPMVEAEAKSIRRRSVAMIVVFGVVALAILVGGFVAGLFFINKRIDEKTGSASASVQSSLPAMVAWAGVDDPQS